MMVLLTPPSSTSARMPPRITMSMADLAQRGVVTGLVGMGVWGLWLTAAVWKSRRDDSNIHGIIGPSPEIAKMQELQFRELPRKGGERINPPPANPS